MIEPYAMASLMCEHISQPNRVTRRRRVEVISRINHHIAVIGEEIISQHIGIAVNVVSTDPHVSSNPQHAGVRRRVSERSTIVCR